MFKFTKRKKLFNILILFLFFVFSYWLMNHTFGYKNDQFHVAEKVWSDFAAHIPLIRSFSMGDNFPPEYPTFPGEPIRYHYLFYLMVGMLEKVGLPIGLSFNGLSAFGFTLLLWMIYKTTELVFRKTSAGLLAVFLFLFNGSFSFVDFFTKNPLNKNSLIDIISSKKFASFGPWDAGNVSAFWNLNIYTNQRHLALSFALVLVVIWPILKTILSEKYSLERKWYPVLWVILFIFPILHQAGFIIALIFSSVLLFGNFAYFRKSILKEDIFKVYFIGIVLSLISFLQFSSFGFFGENSQVVSINHGFLSNGNDVISIFKYWVFNIGAYSLVIPILFVWLRYSKFVKNKYLQTNKKNIFIYFYLFVVLFVIANTFQLSTDMINNHKLVNFFMIGMVMGSAGMFTYVWTERKWLRVIIVPLVFIMVFSGLIDFFPIVNDSKFVIDDYKKSDTSIWIDKNTKPKSVFLTSTYLYNPAALVGRKTFLDYGYFAWSMGYNDGARRALLPSIFSESINRYEWCEIVIDSKIDYILLSLRNDNLGERISLKDSMIIKSFEPVYNSDEGDIIYSVSKECENEMRLVK